MTGYTGLGIQCFTCGNSICIGQGDIIFINQAFCTCFILFFQAFSFSHFCSIFLFRVFTGTKYMVVENVYHRHDNGKIKSPFPPGWKCVIKFFDAIIIMIE